MGTNFNYDDADHQTIYNEIHDGMRSGPLQDTSVAWENLAKDIGETAKEYVEKAIRGIVDSRKGAAAEAAATGTGAMLPWMDDVASVARGASQRAQGQANHWVTAYHAIPPVPPAPTSASFFGDPSEWFAQKVDWIPGLTTDEEAAQQFQQDEAERARQAMRVYQSSSNGNLDPSLDFTAPQALDGSVGSLPDSRGGGGAWPGAAGGVPAGVGGQPVGTQPVSSAPVGTAAQFAPSSGGSVGPGAPGSGGWTANPTPGQGLTPAPVPFGTGARGGTPPRGGTGHRGVVGPGSGRAGTSGAPRYPSAGGSVGSGLRPSVGGTGFGPQSGFGPQPGGVPPGAEGAGGSRGSAAAARGAGVGGMGAPFGAGGGQGGVEDREHRSKYLIQSDPHDIVGDLPPTAPPVIGVDLDD